MTIAKEKILQITSKEVLEIAIQVEKELLAGDKIAFSLDRTWASNFPSAPGVYAIFDDGDLVYFGESADLKERMKEVKRTYNHPFRKKVGKIILKARLQGRKFSDEVEKALHAYFIRNLSFTYREVRFGRLEIEDHLIHRNAEKLLNSPGKRNAIRTSKK
ncbi:MAG: hypothetical protein AAF570_20385 [Bacteroidota bacterium]